MKVIISDFGTACVVPNEYGEQREDNRGNYIYMPVAFARVPTGHGRTAVEARRIAERICELLNDYGLCPCGDPDCPNPGDCDVLEQMIADAAEMIAKSEAKAD